MIKLENCHKSFGSIKALTGLSLTVNSGEIYGLLGANGAGKTTAVRIICGLLKPDIGEVHVQADSSKQALPQQPLKPIGYMPQRGGLYDDLTVLENIRFFARAHGLKQATVAAENVLQTNGLMPRAHQQVGHLSGGWRQRVALAAALLPAPRFLLLDEPTAGLDPQARAAMWQQLRNLSDDGVAILVTTHHVDEAARCDRIGYLDAGKLIAQDIPTQLAASLNLHAWHIVSTLAPPKIKSTICQRDAKGYRLIRNNHALPPAFIAWASEYRIDVCAAEPNLNDALDWLASDWQKNSLHASESQYAKFL